MSTTWGNYLTKGVGPSRKYLIGGNWKCNNSIFRIGRPEDKIHELLQNINTKKSKLLKEEERKREKPSRESQVYW